MPKNVEIYPPSFSIFGLKILTGAYGREYFYATKIFNIIAEFDNKNLFFSQDHAPQEGEPQSLGTTDIQNSDI
jgi:hypothetical protein